MAKWDLSKLPEGRKPLPDEWFAERAQMQERIKKLEAEIVNLEAKLAKIAEITSKIIAKLAGGKDDRQG